MTLEPDRDAARRDAVALIDQAGALAVAVAADRAAHALKAGDPAGCDHWKAVVRHAERLLLVRKAGGESFR